MRLPRYAWVLLVALPISAHAEIYACKSKTGMTVYQNFTCDIDSLGLPSPASTTSAPQPPAAPAGSNVTPQAKALPVRAPSTAAARATEPRIGMAVDEVRSLWGEPASTYQDELVEGRFEIWSYGALGTVRFDTSGRVALVEH